MKDRISEITVNVIKWGIMSFIAMFFVACDDEVTYSDMKERERDAVNDYINEKGINLISYNRFREQGFSTSVENNEYVEVDDCYMQIVRNPKDADGARQMKDGEAMNMLIRYSEYNISDRDTITSNRYFDAPDVMRVTLESGTYSATFIDGVMSAYYGDYVPAGWLVPLPYIYLTRKAPPAMVNIIVPHTKGTSTASSYVYPCIYNITFEPQRLYDTD